VPWAFAFDIVITDMRLGDGRQRLASADEARALYPDIIGIIVTGFAT